MRRQILGYLPANLIPALVSVVSVVVFTRILSPREFGLYNVGFSAVMFLHGAVFYALQLAVTRFYPQAIRERREPAFLATLWCGGAALGLGLAAAAALGLLLAPLDPGLRRVLWLAVPVLVLRAAVAMSQAQARAREAVRLYVGVECLHALAGFLAGLAFVTLHHATGADAMAGLLTGALAATLCGCLPLLRKLRQGAFDPALLGTLVRFALPLAGSYAVTSVLAYADRFLIDAFAGAGKLGLYAVALALVERPTTLLCTLISTATFPMAIRAMEHEGIEAARAQTARNGTALLGLALPACAGLALCAGHIAAVMVGADFRAGVAMLIPPLAVAALLRNFSIHCLDHAFHLIRRPDLLLAIYGPAAAGNVALDVLLIPRLGLMGAVWASVAALGAAAAAGLVLGRRHFGLVLPGREVGRILACVLVMSLVLLGVQAPRSVLGLAMLLASGSAVYGAAAVVLDVFGARGLATRLVRLGRLRAA